MEEPSGPIDVIEILVLEGEEVVVPVDGAPQAIAHRLVAVCVEVEDAEIKKAAGVPRTTSYSTYHIYYIYSRYYISM